MTGAGEGISDHPQVSPSDTQIDQGERSEGNEGNEGIGSEGRPQRRTSWTLTDLMAADFPAPRWAVPGVIPEGVTLFAGPPKVGKSWLLLGLSIAVASGGVALGRITVDPGEVLYLALEDTPRRLQSRAGKILQGAQPPDGLTLSTACPPLPDGGAEAIAGWLDRNPGARLVIIDVFARVRGPVAPGTSAYDADYRAVERAKDIADSYGVAVVLCHHTRKMASPDFLAEVSGTNGLAGAADTIVALKRSRGEADAVLHITGRDVDESELAMEFAADVGAWNLLDGPASDYTLSETRRAILRCVREHEGAGPKRIAEATGIDAAAVKVALGRMVDDGQLDQAGRGHYIAPPTPVTSVTSVTSAGHSAEQVIPRVTSGADVIPLPTTTTEW